MTYILDACALIALLNLEKGCDKVAELFERANSGKIRLLMSIVSLVEVYYGYIREDGLARADEILAPIHETPLVIVDTVSPAIYREVARLKSTLTGFSLADAFVLATAAVYGGTFVTCDYHDLETIESQVNIPFLWIRPKPQK